MTKKYQGNKLLIASSLFAVLLIVGELQSSRMISNPSEFNNAGSSFASFLALLSLISFIFFVYVFSKLNGRWKILPLVYGLIALIILVLAAFAASFSQLGTY